MDKKLKKIIAAGESERTEFKENFDKTVIETASAFANASGGMILIGVDNSGRIKGTSIGKESLKNWMNDISQSTEPTVIPDMECGELNGKKVVLIKIGDSPLKPVSYKGVCYLRVGNGNKKLTPKEISEMHLQTIGSSWDSYLAKGSRIEEIDMSKVGAYIKLANQTGRRKIIENPVQVLKKLDLVKKNKPTWAAILLFGKEPQKIISQAKIHCGRFKDEITIMDDEVIEGDIIEQIDKAIEFVKKNLKLQFVITGRPRREERWEYPLAAVREAVINAICHRDYAEPSDIQLRVYDDKLMIWNPGKLPLGLTLGDLYKQHKSVLRNKLIAQIFFDMGLIEGWGTGIGRMMETCKKHGLPEPLFEEYQGFRVIFRTSPAIEDMEKIGLTKRQILAVQYVVKKGSIGNKEYQDLNSVSKKTATIGLTDLVRRGVFVRAGKGKRGIKYLLLAQKYPKSIQKSIQKEEFGLRAKKRTT